LLHLGITNAAAAHNYPEQLAGIAPNQLAIKISLSATKSPIFLKHGPDISRQYLRPISVVRSRNLAHSAAELPLLHQQPAPASIVGSDSRAKIRRSPRFLWASAKLAARVSSTPKAGEQRRKHPSIRQPNSRNRFVSISSRIRRLFRDGNRKFKSLDKRQTSAISAVNSG
jgi:hypothetical protein